MFSINFMYEENKAVRDLDFQTAEKLFIHRNRRLQRSLPSSVSENKRSKPVVRWLEEQQHNYTFTSLGTGNDLCNRPLIQPPALIRRERN